MFYVPGKFSVPNGDRGMAGKAVPEVVRAIAGAEAVLGM